jgi:hypothetical protein
MGDELDLTTRQLCPDGACIGVIGADGRCKVCGRAGDGPFLGSSNTDTATDTDSDTDTDSATDADADSDPDAASGIELLDDDPDRELCPDGACIGIIGPDRRCKVCGRASVS